MAVIKQKCAYRTVKHSAVWSLTTAGALSISPHLSAPTQYYIHLRMSNVGEQMSKTVESAKEAAAKVGEQVSDFFQGNPFSTPVGKKIDRVFRFCSNFCRSRFRVDFVSNMKSDDGDKL
uniref:Uncharacterized protein n=1 Tax=Heterorhabditis bacteriophora TaxID=37862 RepID=A0A1I7WX04_HETBA